jgi:hypothetical protein
MTCFWNGLLNGLPDNKIKEVLKINRKPKPIEFVKLLKNNAIKTPNILWNGEKLRNQELDENLLRVKELKENSIGRGYDCSCCDPYLLLICQLFKVNIVHNFNRTIIKYTYSSASNTNVPTLKFSSNRGHFWHTR